MKFILALFMLFLLVSCNNKKPIYYKYNDIIVTRVDRGNKIYFYYGKFSNGDYPAKYVEAEYSGFNSGMQAYLTFRKDGKVEIRRVMAGFQKIGNEPNLNIKNDDNVQFNPWLDSIRNNYNNTIEVSDILKIEQKRNLINHTKVTAKYPN